MHGRLDRRWCVVFCVCSCGVVCGVGVVCVHVVCVNVVCVLCVRVVWWRVCGVCGVWCSLAREKTLCVDSQRLRVNGREVSVCTWPDARMCSTCARFASTHGSVLTLHAGTGKGGGGGGGGGEGFSSLSFSLPFSLSLFRRSLSLPSFSCLVVFGCVSMC